MAKTVDKINAGVVVVTRFVASGNKLFTAYINYIDRDEATRNENFFSYSLYQDYMDDPNKSSSLFTADKDQLNPLEKQKLKKVFETAQKNQSLMWQTVISFDNHFLEENGIYHSETQMVDEIKLRELTRGCMGKILEKEKMSGTSIWSAAVHFNTDNIHIHVATVEPIPTRGKIIYQGKEQYRGKFKYSSISAGKSNVVNQIMKQQPENQLINNLIRGTFIKNLKERELDKDDALSKMFLDIYKKLPNDQRNWFYNKNEMKEIRPLIDELSKAYLDIYHKKDFEKLQSYLQIQEDKYKTAYGTGQNNSNTMNRIQNDFASNKLDDMYTRMGNAILTELRAYDKENRAAYYKYVKNHKQSASIQLPKHYKLFQGNNSISLRSCLKKLKRTLHDDFEKRKNMMEYEQLEEKIQKETDRNQVKDTYWI